MAGAADYEIVSAIVVKDASTAALGGIERRIAGIERQALSAGRGLSSMVTGLFAAIGGAAGVGLAVRGFVGLHASIQDATMGMAGLMTAVDHTPIAESISNARTQILGLRKDAAAGVGSFNDYLEGFQTIFAPARQAGASNDKIRELTRNAIASGFALHGKEGATNMVFDVQQALGGAAGVRNTRQLNILLQSIGISTTALNAAKPEKRLEMINRALATMAPGAEAMGRTWTAQWDTFKDNLRGVVLTAGQPLFDKWTDQLRRANQWFVRNSKALEEMADRWGPRLLEMWDQLIAKAGTYAAIVAGATVAQGVSSAGGASKLLSGVGARVAGLAGGAGPMAAIVLGFLAVKGALAEYPGLLRFITLLFTETGRTLGRLGTSLEMLTAKGSGLNDAGAVILTTFAGLITVFDIGVRIVSSLVTGLAVFFRFLGNTFTWIKTALSGTPSDTATAGDRFFQGFLEGREQLKSIWTFGPGDKKTLEDAANGKTSGVKGAKNPDTNVNLNGPITIVAKTEVNEDPARVAYVMGSVLEGLGRFRQQARRVPRPA